LLVVIQSRFLEPEGRGRFVLVVLTVSILARLFGQLGVAVTTYADGAELRPLVQRALLLTLALDAAGIAAHRLHPDTANLDARVEVVPATLAKGLEYDHVVVVDPAAIAAAEPRGLRRLYVVLTRAVSRLSVVHAEPLPDALTAA
jgi:hypothetical protein